jgi:hypothetical protein
MTAQRQEITARPLITAFGPKLALWGLWLGLFAATLFGISPSGIILDGRAGFVAAAQAATTERVVANRYTGLAIEGFDPVAYFVDARAEIGREDFEATEAGAVWRFRNEGNRAWFVAHPEIYGPRFGGYDPVDLARGVTIAGNPRFWLISGQRLYLFSREQARDAFAADTQRLLKEATARWPELEQDLAQ